MVVVRGRPATLCRILRYMAERRGQKHFACDKRQYLWDVDILNGGQRFICTGFCLDGDDQIEHGWAQCIQGIFGDRYDRFDYAL